MSVIVSGCLGTDGLRVEEPNSQMIIVEAELAAAGDLPERVQAGLVVRVTR